MNKVKDFIRSENKPTWKEEIEAICECTIHDIYKDEKDECSPSLLSLQKLGLVTDILKDLKELKA